MAKVTAENLNPIHTRAGRACLDWSMRDLGEASGLSQSLLKKFESGRGASDSAKQTMIDALEAGGVELLNGKRHGARLAKAV